MEDAPAQPVWAEEDEIDEEIMQVCCRTRAGGGVAIGPCGSEVLAFPLRFSGALSSQCRVSPGAGGTLRTITHGPPFLTQSQMTTEEIKQRTRAIEEEMRYTNSEIKRLQHTTNEQKESIKVRAQFCGAKALAVLLKLKQAPLTHLLSLLPQENKEKIKLNKQLPYLVGNVVEVLDIGEESDEEDDGGAQDLSSTNKGGLCGWIVPVMPRLWRRRSKTGAPK